MNTYNHIIGNQYNFGDVHDSNINIMDAQKDNIHLSVPYPENLIERRDMLEKIGKNFETHDRVVLKGIGGSGKTSLAYLYAKEEKFDNVAWVTINSGNILTDFLSEMGKRLLKNNDAYSSYSRNSDDMKLMQIKELLSTAQGNNLIVFDINTNSETIKEEIENNIHNYIPNGNWKTLILTRTNPEFDVFFVSIEVNEMKKDDAKKLFKKNWKRSLIIEDSKLDIIIEELYFHPLLIEQTAIAFSKGHEKNEEDIINKIKNKKLKNEYTEKILRGLVSIGKVEQKYYTYLINLCNINDLKLTDEDINFIASFVIWPNEPIDYDVINTLITKNVDDILDRLVVKGVISHNYEDQYSMHSLITDVLREQINVDKNDYTEYLRNVENIMNDESARYELHKYSKYIASSFFHYMVCNDNELLCSFINGLVNIEDEVASEILDSKYMNCLDTYTMCLNSFQLAKLYNALGRLYDFMGKELDAKQFLDKAFEALKRTDDCSDKCTLYVNILINYAIIEYKTDGKIAKNKIEEALKLVPDMDLLADLLNNYAMIVEDSGNIEYAIYLYEQAIKIREKKQNSIPSEYNLNCIAGYKINFACLLKMKSIEKNTNPKIIDGYGNKCDITHSKEIIQTKKIFNEALNILKSLPENPKNLNQQANILGNLADIEMELGHKKDSNKLIEKALTIKSDAFTQANNYCFYAKLRSINGELKEAKYYLEEALHLLDNTTGNRNIQLLKGKIEKALSSL